MLLHRSSYSSASFTCCSCLVVAQKVCRIKFPAELEEGAGEYRKDPFPQQKFVPKSSQSLGRKVLMLLFPLSTPVALYYQSSPEKLPFPGISKPLFLSKLVCASSYQNPGQHTLQSTLLLLSLPPTLTYFKYNICIISYFSSNLTFLNKTNLRYTEMKVH